MSNNWRDGGWKVGALIRYEEPAPGDWNRLKAASGELRSGDILMATGHGGDCFWHFDIYRDRVLVGKGHGYATGEPFGQAIMILPAEL